MRTIELKVYPFDELSEEAKEKALQNYASDAEYFWGDDAIKSLEEFMKHFNCELSHYSINWGEGYGNSIQISIPGYMKDISEIELSDYIKDMGSFNLKTLNGNGDCKFTGLCFDEDAGDGARKAFFDGVRDLYDILYAGYESWYSSCNSDFEYQCSMEGYAEHCEANEYEFDEEGDMI